jgi:Domain of unknown function (DUF4304)
MAERAEMDAALKAIVLPELRSLGFKGSLPHLHRTRGNAYDLLTLQFLSAGGAFTIELGRVAPDGLWFAGRQIPVKKLNTTYLRWRHRLGAPFEGGDHWYRFAQDDPATIARQVLADLANPAVWRKVDSFELPASSA